MLTIVDPREYSPDEYNIVALPSETLRRQTALIQERLVRIFGDAIWLTPSDALHITIMEVTGPHSLPIELRQGRYQHWQRNYGQTIKDMIATFPSASLHFDQIRVSQRAIIVQAADPDALNEMRAALLSKTELPEGTNLPPDIAHMTIARFSEAIDLDDAEQRTKPLSIDHHEYLTAFSLLRDITPPDFNVVVIDTYPLAQ